MRILHISTRLILGGSQENTVLSCEGQARLAHDVHLAFGPIFGPEGSMLDRIRSFNNTLSPGPDPHDADPCQQDPGPVDQPRPITTHEVPDLIRQINPIRDLRCLRQLKRLIRSVNPDIVHTHSSKAGILGRSSAWSVLKNSSTRTPAIVHTIHGPPFHRFQSRSQNAVYVLAERHAARRCHIIVSVADAMTRQFLEHKIGRPEQYVTIRSAMELDPFVNPLPGQSRPEVRKRLGIADDDFIIGTVSRLAELKGHDDLLDALGDELRTHPNWKLLWVGDGWWKDRLLTRAREMGLGDRIITTGLVPPQQIPGLIRAMDVLAHPSYREGLPRAVTQAMLARTAVIASDVDGTREVCIHRKTGILFQAGDLRALRQGVVELAKSPDSRETMTRAGHEHCVRHFGAQTMVDALEKVYARAIELA